MLYLMEVRNESVVFAVGYAPKIRTLWATASNQTLNTGANANPLFSLAPPRFCVPAHRFCERGTHAGECEFVCLWQVDHRGVCKYRARIVRVAGNATCIHDCIARVNLTSRLHAVCLSVTSVSLRLQGHLVLFMVYQLPRVPSFAPNETCLAVPSRLTDDHSLSFKNQLLHSATFRYFMQIMYANDFHNNSSLRRK